MATTLEKVSSKEFQFFMTATELQECLLDGLPPTYGPYCLLGVDLVKNAGQGRAEEQVFQGEIAEYERLLGAARNDVPDRSLMWIRSFKLSPADASKSFESAAAMSLEGMVLLDPGQVNRGVRGVSRIAIVNRVRNAANGRIQEKKDYLAVFNALRRRIREGLCYSSVWRFADGRVDEDARIMMSAGVVERIQGGAAYRAEPGAKVRGQR
jgi:hypothetical protein